MEQTQNAKVWCQYIAGMIDCYLRTMPDESEREAAIAGIIERRLQHLVHVTAFSKLP